MVFLSKAGFADVRLVSKSSLACSTWNKVDQLFLRLLAERKGLSRFCFRSLEQIENNPQKTNVS